MCPGYGPVLVPSPWLALAMRTKDRQRQIGKEWERVRDREREVKGE